MAQHTASHPSQTYRTVPTSSVSRRNRACSLIMTHDNAPNHERFWLQLHSQQHLIPDMHTESAVPAPVRPLLVRRGPVGPRAAASTPRGLLRAFCVGHGVLDHMYKTPHTCLSTELAACSVQRLVGTHMRPADHSVRSNTAETQETPQASHAIAQHRIGACLPTHAGPMSTEHESSRPAEKQP